MSIVDGRAQAECAVPFDGTPAADRLAGHRSLPVAVRDPWAFAAATRDHPVEILNSPPSLARAVSPATACAESSISWSTGCTVRLAVSPVSFTVAPVAFDPDGDPVLLEALPAAGGSATPGQAICTTTACPTFQLVQPATTFCGSTYVAPSRLRATDGAAAAELGVSPDPTRC
jgi:hypothetical protein